MNQEQSTTARGDILVVDDSPANLSLLTQMLSTQGYKVRVAPNGELALKSVQYYPPNIILLDIMMPLIDGYEVCKRLKAEQQTKDIPVIFLSALDEVLDKVKAFHLGAVDYISKPFENVEVLARIENQLTIQRQKKRLEEEIYIRKKIEENLQESRGLLESVLNSSLDGIMAFNSVRDKNDNVVDFECLLVNPVAAETIGKAKKNLMRKHFLKELPSLKKTNLLEYYTSIVTTGIIINKEFYYEHEYVKGWFQIVAVKIGDGVAVTFRDITDRKRMELTLQQANLILEKKANIDSLTHLANRRRFDEYLNQEWRRMMEEKQPLSLIICDVDYFKLYNDSYGHQTGDECLRQVAGAIARSVRYPEDLAARYGGEEFAIILPNTRAKNAVKVAQKIRYELQKLKIPHRSSTASQYVTLSLGVSSMIPTEELSPADSIAAADEVLYEAKKQGRDRVVLKQ
ncbi:MAG: diguanylate cyclase [Cyanobacteriota bacterium]|nr:diguanylate cyclase [Cyanobacteriota bacterium]